MKTWRNNGVGSAGGVPSASPVKTATSKPGWMLTADLVVRPDAANWAGFTEEGGWGPAWQNLPAHKNAGSALPAGGNEVFIDGSARWVKAKGAMMFSRSWRWAGSFVSFRRTWERWNLNGPAYRKCRNPGRAAAIYVSGPAGGSLWQPNRQSAINSIGAPP